MNEKTLLLFEDCKVVKGYRRSAIYDLCRNEFKFIPNSLAQIITDFKGKTVGKLLSSFSSDDQPVIKEYLHFLFQHEYIHFCDADEVDFFPELNQEFKYPGEISNSIIELSPTTIPLFESIVTQLITQGCSYLELRAHEVCKLAEFSNVLTYLKDAPIRSISLVVKYSPKLTVATLSDLISNHPRVISVLVHSAEASSFEEKKSILFSKDNLQRLIKTKLPSPSSFNVNSQLYHESQTFNAFFNQKVCVDQAGYWKNGLELDQTFGDVVSTPLQDVLQNSAFKRLWHAQKDEIDTCKHCEFRYMCVDARTPIQKNDETGWHFKGSCNYNPYIAKWRHEEGFEPISKSLEVGVEQ